MRLRWVRLWEQQASNQDWGAFTSRQEVCGITAYVQLATAVLCVGECMLCTEYDEVSNIVINFIFGFSSLVRIKQRVGLAPTITSIISLSGGFHCFLWHNQFLNNKNNWALSLHRNPAIYLNYHLHIKSEQCYDQVPGLFLYFLVYPLDKNAVPF